MDRKERVELANSYIIGYAKDLITDEECNDMIDLVLNEISIIVEKDDWCHYSGMPSPEAYK